MSAKTKKQPTAGRIACAPQPEPAHDEIALCAMSIWEEEGRPQGRELEHWLLAEARLRQRCQANANNAGEQPRHTRQKGSNHSRPDSLAF